MRDASDKGLTSSKQQSLCGNENEKYMARRDSISVNMNELQWDFIKKSK